MRAIGRRSKTADDVYAHLFGAIVDQRLLPGPKLTEMALMEAFNVSRRLIGVALQRLTWEGLVVTFPNRGAYVAAPDAAEVREIFAARIAIEAGTTEAVAKAGDPQALAKLADNLAASRSLRRTGPGARGDPPLGRLSSADGRSIGQPHPRRAGAPVGRAHQPGDQSVRKPERPRGLARPSRRSHQTVRSAPRRRPPWR